MSWTTPRTWVAGEVVTAAIMNTHVRDDLAYLHGDPGTTDLANTLRFGNGSTMRGHRHPYANERHLESGSVSVAGGSTTMDTAVTFTDAFASAPNVACGASGTDIEAIALAISVTTTGFTLRLHHVGGAALSAGAAAYWIADGQD